MDKVDRSVSRIQGCRRVDWPLVGALLASFWVSRSCSWGSRLSTDMWLDTPAADRHACRLQSALLPHLTSPSWDPHSELTPTWVAPVHDSRHVPQKKEGKKGNCRS